VSSLQPIERDKRLFVMPRNERDTRSPGQIIFLWTDQRSFPESFPREAIGSALEETVRRFFNRYADEWYTATAGLSSIAQKKRHPSYNEIIKLGPTVIKFMLEDLERRLPSPMWFPALKSMTGHDPVAPSDRGNIAAMKRAWIEWGRANKYL
jgi:hypothetical protein